MSTQQQKQTNTVEQVQAEVNLTNLKVTLTGQSTTEIQNRIRMLFGPNGDQIRFEPYGENSHTINQGQNLVGWMATAEVPVSLSQEHQKKAAERQAA